MAIRKGSLRWKYWMLVLDIRDWWKGKPQTTWHDGGCF